jgi:hypothetical protein
MTDLTVEEPKPGDREAWDNLINAAVWNGRPAELRAAITALRQENERLTKLRDDLIAWHAGRGLTLDAIIERARSASNEAIAKERAK